MGLLRDVRAAAVCATALTTALLLGGCGGGDSTDESSKSNSPSDSSQSPAGSPGSEETTDAPDSSVPEALPTSPFCDRVDEAAVETFLDSAVTQRSEAAPGDKRPAPQTGKETNFICQFSAQKSAADVSRGVYVAVTPPETALPLSELRSNQEENAASNPAAKCETLDIPGLSADAGFGYSCPRVRTGSTSAGGFTAITVAAGDAIFRCGASSFEDKDHFTTLEKTAAFCLDQLARIAG